MSTHETLNPPSAAQQSLPVNPTPGPSARAHFPQKSSDWNFLRGEGPSSSAMYYAEEKAAFKPGWKSLKHQDAIQQDKERVQHNAIKEQRNTAIRGLRAENTHQCQSVERFNPITGCEQKESGWQPASNPWQHQRVVARPAAVIASMEPKPDPKEKSAKMAEVHEMRKARIANDGLFTSKRTGGTAADCLRWG